MKEIFLRTFNDNIWLMAYTKIESNGLEYFNCEFESFIYLHVRYSDSYTYLRCVFH